MKGCREPPVNLVKMCSGNSIGRIFLVAKKLILIGAVIFLGHEKNATWNLQTCPSKMADPRTTSSEDLSFVEICLDWSWEDLKSDFGKVSQRLETVAGSFFR